MTQYTQGIVYKIQCITTGRCYYGSTKRPLHTRFREHIRNYNNWLNDKTVKYCSSYEVLMNDNYFIRLMESSYCTKTELLDMEGAYQRMEPCVNRAIANRSKKEYNHDPIIKAKTKVYNANYYQKNRTEILKTRKLEYPDKREEILKYQHEYYINNPDECKARSKKLYNKKKSYVICECGIMVYNVSMKSHLTSHNHVQLMTNYDEFMIGRTLCTCHRIYKNISKNTHFGSKHHMKFHDM